MGYKKGHKGFTGTKIKSPMQKLVDEFNSLKQKNSRKHEIYLEIMKLDAELQNNKKTVAAN